MLKYDGLSLDAAVIVNDRPYGEVRSVADQSQYIVLADVQEIFRFSTANLL